MGLRADIHSIAESLKRLADHFCADEDFVRERERELTGQFYTVKRPVKKLTEEGLKPSDFDGPVEFFEYDTEKHYEWEQEQLRKRAANPLEPTDELEEL